MIDINRNPLDLKNEEALFKAIRNLPHKRIWICIKCDTENECPTLAIYSDCENCGTHCKMRSFWGGTDLQDVLLIALQWLEGAGVEVPPDMRPLVDKDWTDWDQYYGDDAD